MIAERASFFKEKEEGVAQMCRVMDELRKEAVQERNYEIAIKMLNDKDVTDEKISEFTGIVIEEIQKLRKELYSWSIEKRLSQYNG